MQHGNEVTVAMAPLTRLDAAGMSRKAREARELRQHPVGVFRLGCLHRGGGEVSAEFGYGTEIATQGRYTIIRMPNHVVVVTKRGQFSR